MIEQRRHSDPTLLALEQLHRTLNADATAPERDAWWNIVLRVQSSLESDPRASKVEKDAMRRLRERITDVYGMLNRGKEASYSGAMVAVTGLSNMLEARTTGFDGRRLR